MEVEKQPLGAEDGALFHTSVRHLLQNLDKLDIKIINYKMTYLLQTQTLNTRRCYSGNKSQRAMMNEFVKDLQSCASSILIHFF